MDDAGNINEEGGPFAGLSRKEAREKVVKSDMWTPSGMIQSIDTTKPITISGNAYDDWYIGRK